MRIGTYVHLVPHEWLQTISHYPSISVEGLKLTANCRCEDDHELMMSNGKKLHNLPINVTILSGNIPEKHRERVDGGIGLFAFHAAQKGGIDYPGTEDFIGAWFYVRECFFQEIWAQVRQGDYAECRLSLEVGPVAHEAFEWRWDVSEDTPPLNIGTYSLDFTRKPRPQAEAHARKFWLGWG